MALPTITNNSPSAGRIAWTGFSIQYDGVGYSIPASNTDKRFVWWEYNGGTPIVQAADTLPTLAPEDFLLFLNKGGIGLLVDTTQVIDGSLIVAGSILADGIGANQIESWHVNANAITAGKIAAGAVTASTIDAGAVTAEKLSIGAVGDNMVLNGSFEDGVQGFEVKASGAGAVADVVTGVSSSGANALRLVRGTASNLEVAQDAARYIPVTSVAGRSWYVACRAGAGSALASGFTLRVYWLQADKVTAASTASVDVAANVALTTAWSVFESAVTPPANARYMRVAVINGLSGSTMYVDEITAHEVIMSAQIGNGQITAAKIASNTITANQIAANAVSVSELAANAVTADKIAANAITAAKIEATAIDGKTITGATVRTAASGQRVQLDTTGLRAFDAENQVTARLTTDDLGMVIEGSSGEVYVSGQVGAGVFAQNLYDRATHQLYGNAGVETITSVDGGANPNTQISSIFAQAGPTSSPVKVNLYASRRENGPDQGAVLRAVGAPLKIGAETAGGLPLSVEFTSDVTHLGDTTWGKIDALGIATLGSGFAHDTDPYYGGLWARIKAGVVYITGRITKSSFAGNSTLFTINSGFLPAKPVVQYAYTGGANFAVAQPDGVTIIALAGTGGATIGFSWPLE